MEVISQALVLVFDPPNRQPNTSCDLMAGQTQQWAPRTFLHSPSLPYRGRPQRADARRLILVLGGVAPPGSLVHPVEEMTPVLDGAARCSGRRRACDWAQSCPVAGGLCQTRCWASFPVSILGSIRGNAKEWRG